jgi:hypothetical protein
VINTEGELISFKHLKTYHWIIYRVENVEINVVINHIYKITLI